MIGTHNSGDHRLEEETEDELDISGHYNWFKIAILLIQDGSNQLRDMWRTKWSEMRGIPWDSSYGPEVYFDELCQRNIGTKNLPPAFFEGENRQFKPRINFRAMELFPNQVDLIQNGDITQWDISLLCILLSKSFTMKNRLKDRELKAVNTFQRLRNNDFGHTASLAMSDDYFARLSNKVIDCLVSLGANKDVLERKIRLMFSFGAEYQAVESDSHPERMQKQLLMKTLNEIKDPNSPLRKKVDWLYGSFFSKRKTRLAAWITEYCRLPDSDQAVIDMNMSQTASAGAYSHEYLTGVGNDVRTMPDYAIKLLVAPENELVNVYMKKENELVIGNVDAMVSSDHIFEMIDRPSSKYWLLGLEDRRLSGDNCRVYFNSESNKWRVKVDSDTPHRVWLKRGDSVMEELPAGESKDLEKGDQITFSQSKHCISIVDIQTPLLTSVQQMLIDYEPDVSFPIKRNEAFGSVVCRYVHKLSREKVFVKAFKKRVCDNSFFDRVEILKGLSHPFLCLPKLDDIQDAGCVMLLYEPAGEDLGTFLNKRFSLLHAKIRDVLGTDVTPGDTLRVIILQVGLALFYLHNLRPESIAHRDIKPSNVAIEISKVVTDANFYVPVVKLIDLETIKPADGVTTRNVTSAGYTPPELPPNSKSVPIGYNFPCKDCFAVGKLLHDLWSGNDPELEVVIKGLTDADWRKRWSIHDMLLSPWLLNTPANPTLKIALCQIAVKTISGAIANWKLADFDSKYKESTRTYFELFNHFSKNISSDVDSESESVTADDESSHDDDQSVASDAWGSVSGQPSVRQYPKTYSREQVERVVQDLCEFLKRRKDDNYTIPGEELWKFYSQHPDDIHGDLYKARKSNQLLKQMWNECATARGLRFKPRLNALGGDWQLGVPKKKSPTPSTAPLTPSSPAPDHAFATSSGSSKLQTRKK